jgi:hypothetical protein
MTALSINATDREEPTTWGNLHTSHPESRLHALAMSAWKLAGLLADEENPNWLRIKNLQAAAEDLERMDREGWEGEVTARDADWHDQQINERP